MQQRLGLAQALLNEPELIVLDEPSIGLDPIGMVEVRDIMRELSSRGVTIFLSSHLLHEVEQVCTHVTMINKGVAMASGTLKEISNKLQSPLAIDVEVEKLSQPVIENLKKLPFIGNIDRDGNRLLIALKTRDDVRSRVSQTITSAGGIILSMIQKGTSLEDAFLKLIAPNEKGA
jgi:ABC-2 type transport system ATP-binding protein